MKTLTLSAALALLACWSLPPAAAAAGPDSHAKRGRHGDRSFAVRDSEEIRKTFGGDGARIERVVVDDFEGSIRVVGHPGDEVRVVAQRTNRARTAASLEQAKREVVLDATADGAVVRLYVDGPFRRADGSIDFQGDRYDYRVRFDIEVEVPATAAIDLCTVNDGDIHVRGVGGSYDVENTNGEIEMQDVAGSGRVYALNGEVRVAFADNPDRESYFGSLNGDVEVAFRDDLAAELQLSTKNGDIYTDFETTAGATAPAAVDREGGRNVYRAGSAFGLRVGRGGPKLEFDAMNGDILIVKRER
jgi:hypothetical protein